MEGAINLFNLFMILKKRWKLIVILTLAAALTSGILSYYVMVPIYQASTQILVNQKTSENRLDYSMLQSNKDLIDTYSDIIKSPVILEKVIEKLNFKQSVEDINQNMTIVSGSNSQVFSLIIENPNPREAVEIANTVSETFQQEIKGIMNVDNVSILAKAEFKKNPAPVKPRPILNIAIGVVLGLMAGIGIALLLNFMDNTLKDDEDVALLLDVPVLGTIHKMSKADKKARKDSMTQKMERETIVS